MIVPPLLAYTLVPFGSGIREKVYYKFYELGNNGFYIPSISEREEETEEENTNQEVNVE
jgi:hypothetical protein